MYVYIFEQKPAFLLLVLNSYKEQQQGLLKVYFTMFWGTTSYSNPFN